jgi:asparagine synthase (glutamine-hydrolysing)
MCGIFGHVSTPALVKEKEVEEMKKSLGLLKHRGPDGESSYIGDQCALGFRHLAFFDGTTSLQPLSNKQKTLFVVCNGELYNYQDLQTELPTYPYQSTSDCEVLIPLYEKYGVDFVSHLKGQFAIAIWDTQKQIVLLARDKFGICPLYYVRTANDLYFSSEITPLLEYGKERKLDSHELISSILFYGPDPSKTCFSGIFQVPPAHILEYGYKKKELTTKRYWNPVFREDTRLENVTDSDVVAEFSFLLYQAVKKRTHGQHTPGVYVSGGIDSSSVARILSEITPQTCLFSLQFTDRTYDESRFQDMVYTSLGLPYQTATISSGDILSHFIETLKHGEVPLSRSAPIPMYILSNLVKNSGFKTVLSGEGADELLAGYPVFLKQIPSIVEKYQKFKDVVGFFADSERLRTSMENRYTHYMHDYSDLMNSIHTAQRIEMDTKLSRYLLSAQGDRVSMAHGVEQRFPFLDDDLVDFILRLPMRFFVDAYQGKQILRQAMNNRLPEPIRTRAKQGYLSPDRIFLDGLATNDTIRDVCSERNIRAVGLFEYKTVQQFFQTLERGQTDETSLSMFLFLLSVLCLDTLYIQQKDIFI